MSSQAVSRPMTGLREAPKQRIMPKQRNGVMAPPSAPPSAPPLKEAGVRDAVVTYLRRSGWFVYYNFQGKGAYRGVSDLVAVKRGRAREWIVHIELKRPSGGHQDDDQARFERDLVAHGGVYLLVRSVDDVTNWERSVEWE